MFKNAEETLERILALVAKCPEGLQEKCFDILLRAYVDNSVGPAIKHIRSPNPNTGSDEPPASGNTGPATTPVPEAIKSRLVAMAGRMKVTPSEFAALFDFQLDPFNYHALAVPGDNKAEKSRNVALLLAAKAYLTTGAWTADWKEFRAVCVDQNCFDANNYAKHLKNPFIKEASAVTGVTLSGAGVTGAEALIRKLTGAAE